MHEGLSNFGGTVKWLMSHITPDPGQNNTEIMRKAYIQLLSENNPVPESFFVDAEALKDSRRSVQECAFIVAVLETRAEQNLQENRTDS